MFYYEMIFKHLFPRVCNWNLYPISNVAKDNENVFS